MELKPGMLLFVNPEKCHDDLDDGPYLLLSYDDGEKEVLRIRALERWPEQTLEPDPDPIWTCLDGDEICTMREEFLLECCDVAV